MNSSANSIAKRVNIPTMDSMKVFIAIGCISAIIPIIMHASTTTTPSRSPIASSPCPFFTLCSENVNSGSVVPSATNINPINREGIPICIASACALSTTKWALNSIIATLAPNMKKCLSQWSFIWKGLWKYALSFSSTARNISPVKSRITPSSLDSTPLSPSSIGSSTSMTK